MYGCILNQIFLVGRIGESLVEYRTNQTRFFFRSSPGNINGQWHERSRDVGTKNCGWHPWNWRLGVALRISVLVCARITDNGVLPARLTPSRTKSASFQLFGDMPSSHLSVYSTVSTRR
jgi:hypothetical protein